jgi:hypothetical protein
MTLVVVVLLFNALPPARAADPSEGHEISDRFRRLTRSSSWRKADEIKLAFRTYHPQGMTIVGGRFFLSSVEVLDRKQEKGKGHLFEVDFEGKLLREIQLGEGPHYHPGGIDFDGRWIWVPVAEYRPNSSSIVYRVDPEKLEVNRVFEFGDHLGALVSEAGARRLVGASWGSRRFYRWELQGNGQSPVAPDAPAEGTNESFYVDYQDGQSLPGTGLALFGGVSSLPTTGSVAIALGGLELVDLHELRAVRQLPMALRTIGGRSLLQNPFAVQLEAEGLRFYFIPEDEESKLHVYDVAFGSGGGENGY